MAQTVYTVDEDVSCSYESLAGSVLVDLPAGQYEASELSSDELYALDVFIIPAGIASRDSQEL